MKFRIILFSIILLEVSHIYGNGYSNYVSFNPGVTFGWDLGKSKGFKLGVELSGVYSYKQFYPLLGIVTGAHYNFKQKSPAFYYEFEAGTPFHWSGCWPGN